LYDSRGKYASELGYPAGIQARDAVFNASVSLENRKYADIVTIKGRIQHDKENI